MKTKKKSIECTYKPFDLKKNEITMAAYREYEKLKSLVERKIKCHKNMTD